MTDLKSIDEKLEKAHRLLEKTTSHGIKSTEARDVVSSARCLIDESRERLREVALNLVDGSFDMVRKTKGENMNILGDELLKEQVRCRELLGRYKVIGPAGSFGAMVIEECLKYAEMAVLSGDLGQMIVAYQKLKGLS